MAGTVNFYLKKPDSSGLSLIYLQFKYNGRRLVFSTGQSIDKKDWNPGTMRVKKNNKTTKDGKYSLNDLLDNLSKECERAYNEELSNGYPSPKTLNIRLDSFMKGDNTKDTGNGLYELIERFEGGQILHRGKAKSPNTLKAYKTTKHHLQKFARECKYPVSFDSINLDFYYRFTDYLKKKGLAGNSIGKDIKNIKTFMREAVDMDLTDNLQFEKSKFTVTKEETFAVYLTTDEIIKLYHFGLSNNKRLEQVRDLFVFGCLVGLRYSDYSDIKPENIKEIDGEKYIDIRAKKTGNRVVIPCNPIVLDIFKKYSHMPNRLPKSLSNQKFNEYVKEACQAAGLNEKGRLESNRELELWEAVSSHTARRSFATNLYNEAFPILDLMKITGHKTEKSFLNYIKINENDAAKRLSKHNKKKDWSSFLLKVA